jgi:hypothetical protein
MITPFHFISDDFRIFAAIRQLIVAFDAIDAISRIATPADRQLSQLLSDIEYYFHISFHFH